MQTFATPEINLLDTEQIEHIHRQALKILQTSGVRVDDARIRLMLEKSASAKIDEDHVMFQPELVEWAIERAPESADIFDQLGQPAFKLNGDRSERLPSRFGIGVTALYYMDPGRGDRLVPFNRASFRDMVRLGDVLPGYDIVSTVGILHDVDPQYADLYAALEMVANTTKPLVLLVSEESAFPDVLDLMEKLNGDVAERPYVIPYLNPVTPLVWNAGTLAKLEESVRRDLPVILSSNGMAGMSTPVRAAGALALLLAELWGGLVISQVLKEGTPVILGMLPAYFDMKTLVSFYDPQSHLINLACDQIMRYFRIPFSGTSGSSSGFGADFAALETYWVNTISTCLMGGGLAPFVGDTLGAKAFSPMTVVYVNEIIDQTRRFSKGINLEPDQFCLEEIALSGAGGSFLNARSTRSDFRQAYYPSPIFPRWSMEKWRANGSPAAIELLRAHTCALIEDARKSANRSDLTSKGEAFIQKLRSR